MIVARSDQTRAIPRPDEGNRGEGGSGVMQPPADGPPRPLPYRCRRYRLTASGANTAMIATIQMIV
jgi:hypothetical protein